MKQDKPSIVHMLYIDYPILIASPLKKLPKRRPSIADARYGVRATE